MKVVFTGTIYVGKSTMIERLAGRANVAVIREIARDLINRDPTIETKEEFQDILFGEQVRREADAVNSGANIVICDRSIADNIAHSRYYGHQVKPEWEDWLYTYDHFFLFAANDFPFDATDYPEGIDWIKFRDDLHNQIYQVLTDYKLPFSIVGGDSEARIKLIENIIGTGRTDYEVNPNLNNLLST